MNSKFNVFVPLAAWVLVFLVFVQDHSVYAQSLEPLSITGGSGTHGFQVEVARTPEQREKGLMHRRYMPPDRGMLFDFGSSQSISMWMQDTYISLDMLFIRDNGVIARIQERAEPLSTRIIPSGEPVLAVLELNGGTVARLKIQPGDRVEHGLFKRP